MGKYQSPNGSKIIGTAELIPGTAMIISIDDDGHPEYTGETELDWDNQWTKTRDDKFLFIDDDGYLWTFNQLMKLVDEEEED